MTKSDPFAAYKLPIGLTEGVEISLPDGQATFVVTLPGTMNEDFNLSMLSTLSVSPDENGEVHVNTGVFQSARKKLFFDTCIQSANGIPSGMSIADFFKAYPLAARLVYDRATELAALADQEAAASLEKLKPTPTGRSSGAGDINSTTT